MAKQTYTYRHGTLAEADPRERSQVTRVTWTAGNSWAAEVPPCPSSWAKHVFQRKSLALGSSLVPQPSL